MTIYELKESKLGMTLIEMVISLAILSILMTSTMGMIVSTNNIFISTSQSSLDKIVGNSVFDNFEKIIKYTTHLEISDEANDKLSQSISINETDSVNKSGVVYYKRSKTESVVPFYEDSFYGNGNNKRTVQYSVTPVGSDNKHVNLVVNVYRDGKKVYTREQVIRCLNLALLTGADGNAIVCDETKMPEVNQVLSFSVDELLLSGGNSAWTIEYKIGNFMSDYNEILADYETHLSAAVSEVNALYDTYKDAGNMSHLSKSVYDAAVLRRDKAIFGNDSSKGNYPSKTAAAPVGDDPANWDNIRAYYQQKIYELLKFTPKTITDSSDPYYGVIACREELYAGFLFKYYDKDLPADLTSGFSGSSLGKITQQEYPTFSDVEEFFAGTSLLRYAKGEDSTDNKMVILGYFRDDSNDFLKNKSYYDPYCVVEEKTDLKVTTGVTETDAGASTRRASNGIVRYSTSNWSAVGEALDFFNSKTFYNMEGAVDVAQIDKSQNYVNDVDFSITSNGSSWSASYKNSSSSDRDSINYPKHIGTIAGYKYYERDGNPRICDASVTFNYYTYSISGKLVSYTNGGQKTDNLRRYYKGEDADALKEENKLTSYYYIKGSTANAAHNPKRWYGPVEVFTPTDAKDFSYTTDQMFSYYKCAQYIIDQLDATNIEDVATHNTAVDKKIYYSTTESGGSEANANRVVFSPKTTVNSGKIPQGWYYYVEGSLSDSYGTLVKSFCSTDSAPETYHFFYLAANTYDAGEFTVNKAKTAVDVTAKREDGSACEIQLFISDNQLKFYSYDRAEFVATDEGEGKLIKLDGTNGNGPVKYYNIKRHQYTDWVLYGVDWNSWFDNGTSGLVNTAIKNVASFVGLQNSKIDSITPENAMKSLGNKGHYDVNTMGYDLRSYDAAWMVYNSNRGTWYYIPNSSSIASTTLQKVSWVSNKNIPQIIDVDTTWVSSTDMNSDIDNRRITKPGIFGITYIAGVDFSNTVDTPWQVLPTSASSVGK